MFLKKAKLTVNEDVVSLLHKAGFHKLTQLQQKAIPLIMTGRDAVIETRSGEGKTVTLLLPLIVRFSNNPERISDSGNCRSPAALIITPDFESALKINRQFNRITRKNQIKLRLAVLGKPSAQRQEAGLIAAAPQIVAGTSERIIDHLRRGNLTVGETRTVVVDVQTKENGTGFAADVLFILSKAERRQQTVLFVPSLTSMPDEYSALVKTPYTLGRENWMESRIEHEYIMLDGRENDFECMADIYESRALSHTVVFTSDQERADVLRRTIRRRNITCRYLADSARLSVKNKTAKNFNSREIDVIILIHSSQFHEKLKNVETVVFFDLPREPGNYASVDAYFQDSERPHKVISLVRDHEQTLKEKIEEKQNVRMKQAELPTENEVIEGTIEKILKKIKEEENPDELNRYRKIIRKKVPIFLRAYFAAYLLKESQQKKGRQRRDNYTTLFVSIGKNKRVFPRDLSQVFMTTLDIKKSSLGDIKVLDNYSFVDIAPDLAQKAIDTLNGTQLKGRRITVNFARKKEEEKAG